MPAVVLDRLHTVQPYRFEPVEMGIGILLDKMSNLDKHRAALTLELRVADKTHFNVKMLPDNPGGARALEYEFVAPDRSVADGDRVFVFKESQPVRDPVVEKLPLLLAVTIDGALYDAFFLLHLIERQVASTFINACVGTAPVDWREFMTGNGPRPLTPWYPNLGRYSTEMRGDHDEAL
jgi:hypothetical protein